jgi:hypothetical protein
MMPVVPFPKTSEGKQKRSQNAGKATRAAGQASTDAPYKRKLIAFDAETWHALHLLGRDTMKDIQELADEAFADVLKKYHRPTELKEALRQSARESQNRSDETPPDLKPLHPANSQTSGRRRTRRRG